MNSENFKISEFQNINIETNKQNKKADNLYLDKLTGVYLGVGKCDPLANTFFEISNFSKMPSRNGEEDDWCLPTHRTDKKAMINSAC